MTPAKVRRILGKIPEKPGVYFMKDKKDRTLYIGKAKNLRNRVSTYFHDSYGDPRIRAMISKVANVEVMETPSEVDALLAEARLIRDTQPRYNDRLKDDKSFTMLAITRYDDFAKVWVVHETDDVDAERFGPFTSAGELRDAVRALQKAFKFATCRIEMRVDDRKRRFFRPCLLHAIGRCSAPCADRISHERYQGDIEMLRRFLQGGSDEVLADLRKRMKVEAKQLEFERAAQLRDQIRSLESLAKRPGMDYIEGDITPIHPGEGLASLAKVLRLEAPPRTIEGVDIAHVAGSESVGSLVSFVDGIPFKGGYRRFRIRSVTGIDDYAMIREVVRRRFKRLVEEDGVMPDILLVDGGVGQLNAAAFELRKLDVKKTLLLSLAKEDETLFRAGRPVRMAKSSPGLRLMMYVRD